MSDRAGDCVCGSRLSALLSALDIVFASVAPLWVDNIRQVQGPPAHRGYRMYLHRTEPKGGKVGRVVPSGLLSGAQSGAACSLSLAQHTKSSVARSPSTAQTRGASATTWHDSQLQAGMCTDAMKCAPAGGWFRPRALCIGRLARWLEDSMCTHVLSSWHRLHAACLSSAGGLGRFCGHRRAIKVLTASAV